MNKTKHQIVANEIKEKIINKSYHAGMLLPTEKQFQRKINVSRYTVRQAMNMLVQDGFLKKKKGSGSYVSYNFLNSNQSKASKKIGVIIKYVSDYIFTSIMRA